mmetsp:Transcript_11328/g.17190  ORF Transcript_11328/g.17190 Transcript_11328/m.17190 type:complete len:266 (-) Transcript_11328:206-1003(-)|eukprot:CAMPEP_0116021714 /NCGR_PEP_ID=MMETSP0321-20121206/10556_1 /TAXON_ID=163516 /ORGANISM="Leptocylindrus danicus var. danicus, Strain B650" /LENGTH=265 /DNA_ID=CAMNT_0003492647 /DNA_START=41 /DNA_END=838 /DNA_ORIENTATION=-
MKRSRSGTSLYDGENERGACEDVETAAGVQDVSIQQFRSGLGYESPGDYTLVDRLPPRKDIVGTYDFVWCRFSSAVPTFFNYHRTVKGTLSVSFVKSGSEEIALEFDIESSFDDLPFDYLKKFNVHESHQTKGSGLMIDSVINFTGSHQDVVGEIAGGFTLLEQNVGLGMQRDGYDVGTEMPAVFESYSEAVEANRRYYDGRNSWLHSYRNLPPEVAVRVRLFVHAPPTIILEKDDLLVRSYWVNKKGKHVTQGAVCRKRKSETV